MVSVDVDFNSPEEIEEFRANLEADLRKQHANIKLIVYKTEPASEATRKRRQSRFIYLVLLSWFSNSRF